MALKRDGYCTNEEKKWPQRKQQDGRLCMATEKNSNGRLCMVTEKEHIAASLNVWRQRKKQDGRLYMATKKEINWPPMYSNRERKKQYGRIALGKWRQRKKQKWPPRSLVATEKKKQWPPFPNHNRLNSPLKNRRRTTNFSLRFQFKF